MSVQDSYCLSFDPCFVDFDLKKYSIIICLLHTLYHYQTYSNSVWHCACHSIIHAFLTLHILSKPNYKVNNNEALTQACRQDGKQMNTIIQNQPYVEVDNLD